MDLRKGPDLYFQDHSYTRTRTIGSTQSQEVNLNVSNSINRNPQQQQLYTPEYVANYNNANSYYREKNDGKNLYNLDFKGPNAVAKDLFVKPKDNKLAEAIAMLGGNLTINKEPSYYRENKESRGGQTMLGAMNSMRGESKELGR